MLQERFSLVVHEDKRPLDAYVLSKGKRAPLLRRASSEADPATAGQCKSQPSPAANMRTISCHGVTLEAFAKQLPAFASDYFFHISMVDQTGLEGSWDFTLQWTTLNQLRSAGGDTLSLFEAVDRQLGLHLEMQKTPLPVVVVDRVNEKPKESTPETLRNLPPPSTEFEVGVIKPSAPGEAPSERELPNGQIEVRGDTLLEHVRYAWGIQRGDESSMVAGPAWMATERFDVIGKVTSENRADAPALDQDSLREMAQNLLISRFKMVVHYEDRPVPVYSLVAGSKPGSKPKIAKADPASRTSCKAAPLPSGSKALTRRFVCQNVTMAKFAEKLRDLATDYIDHPVIDSTGLKGGWSFAFQFSPRSIAQNDTRPNTELAAPDETLTLFEAVEKQLGLKIETKKAPMPVLVIDHIERTPTDN